MSRPEGPRPRRFRHSLLLKLLLVLLGTAACMYCAVGGFFRHHFSGHARVAKERHVGKYALLLAREIGSPPDTARARALADSLFLRVFYDGPGGPWQSHPGPRVGFEHAAFARGGAVGFERGVFAVRVGDGPARYVFSADRRQFIDFDWRAPAALAVILSAILAACFLVMRRILSPLKGLSLGVERLARGELGHQVPAGRGRDELAELARAFNAMSTRLEEMARAREQLLLDVSHELRSPLTRLKVALEMVPGGQAKESMHEDAAEMESMIGEILEAARLDSANGRLHLEEVDLRALAGEVARAFQGRAPGLIVSRGGPGASFTARVDRERIRKVLANVLDNAHKYSGGQMRPVELNLEEAPGLVILRVRDHGVGIPPEELPKLFEPFYRVDRSRSRDTGGYGLGLSLCKRIMEAHGGRIDITSRPGEGAEVSLFLPSLGLQPGPKPIAT